MRVAVIGKSRSDDLIRSYLRDAGLETVDVGPEENIQALQGTIGDFCLRTSNAEILVDSVLVSAESEPQSVGDSGVHPLLELDVSSIGANRPVVFVLDYFEESADVQTKVALEKATALAKRQRTVFYLAKLMRTATPQWEQRYTAARNSGVVFVHYNTVSLDLEAQSVTVEDAFQNIIISDCALVVAEPIRPGRLTEIGTKLGLKLDQRGFIDQTRHFLYPSLTNRRGVYVLDTLRGSVREDDLREALRYMVEDLQMLATLTPENHVEVDNDKCAFCYTCFRACPHVAMEPNREEAVMQNVEKACYACGICVTVCPANAVTFAQEAHRQQAASKLQVFACENSGEVVFARLEAMLQQNFGQVDLAPVTCGGEVTVEGILRALKNYDKVMVAVCMDDACRHFDGNLRACRSVERAVAMLQAFGLADRVEFVKLSQGMPLILEHSVRGALA